MNPTVTRDRTKIQKLRKRTLSFGDIKVYEEFLDCELIQQRWARKGGFKKFYPGVYEASKFDFHYYPDISFLESDAPSNFMSFYDEIPDPVMVTDWDEFKGLNHVLCNWLGMNGCIYSIEEPGPVPLWYYADYIGGVTNDEYDDLDGIVNEMSKFSDLKNVSIKEIPWYNRSEDYTHFVEFTYKRCGQVSSAPGSLHDFLKTFFDIDKYKREE